MAFNGSGTYNLPAGNPVVTGTTISSTTTNTTNSDIATALTNCITRDGQSTPSANLPMNAKKLTGLAAGTSAGDSVRYEQVLLLAGGTMTGAIEEATGTSIASAATVNLNTATGNRVHITGTTTITAITLSRGPRTVIFDGILTLTHHATNNNLPGAANITTAVGDRAIYESDGTTVYCVSYIKANGTPTVATIGGFTSVTVIASSGTWTCPANITKAKIIVTGGGGSAGNGVSQSGGGGGGGGTAIKFLSVSPGTVYTATVGAGGAAIASGAGNTTGNTGGTSSFSGSGITTVSATGGAGGAASSAGGNGGSTFSGHDIGVTGGCGLASDVNSSTPPPYGGGSYWAGISPAGVAGVSYGNGGGGKFNNIGGPAGAAGVIVIEY